MFAKPLHNATNAWQQLNEVRYSDIHAKFMYWSSGLTRMSSNIEFEFYLSLVSPHFWPQFELFIATSKEKILTHLELNRLGMISGVTANCGQNISRISGGILLICVHGLRAREG